MNRLPLLLILALFWLPGISGAALEDILPENLFIPRESPGKKNPDTRIPMEEKTADPEECTNGTLRPLGNSAIPLLAIRPVHPDNERLVREGKAAPEGYTRHIYHYIDYKGKIKEEPLFLKDVPVVTEEQVERAGVDPSRPAHLHITLTSRGGMTMKKATSAMELGRDRMAILVRGKVLSAPVVQAILSRTFEISGLDQEHEAENLGELFNRQALSRKKTPFSPHDLELYAVHPDSERLVEQGVLAVPGYKLWKNSAVQGRNSRKEEYLFLGKTPIVTGRHAQSAKVDMDHPELLNIVWNEEGRETLARACEKLTPGKDRIAIVLKDAVISTPVLVARPDAATLIPAPRDEQQADDICTSINNQVPPLTKQQEVQVKKDLGVHAVHPRSNALAERFLPVLEQGKTVRLKSGYHSVPFTYPDYPVPGKFYAFIRPESLITPEDMENASRTQEGIIACTLLPRAWKKLRAHIDGSPAGEVNVAIVFQGRMRHLFPIRKCIIQLWGIPVFTSIQPISSIYILPPAEEQRMYLEMAPIMIRDYLEILCPWFFKSVGGFRSLGKLQPFLMIDSALDRR